MDNEPTKELSLLIVLVEQLRNALLKLWRSGGKWFDIITTGTLLRNNYTKEK